jgi:hypothetical protein
MVPALVVVVALLLLAYVCACAALAWNISGITTWLASRDLSRTIYRRNNSRSAWQVAGWLGLALGVVAAFILIADVMRRP